MIRAFLEELVFPVSCVSCGKTPSWLCHKCKKDLVFVIEKECPICRRPQEQNTPCGICVKNTNISKMHYLFEYKHEIKKLIRLLKYRRFSSIRGIFGHLLDRWAIQNKLHTKKTLWTFAPSTTKSVKRRGFQHLKEILNESNLTYKELFTKRRGKRQALQDKKARYKSVKGKIKLKAEKSLGNFTQIVIFDDLATTGATLDECCRVFKRKYSKGIKCVVLARAKLKNLKNHHLGQDSVT